MGEKPVPITISELDDGLGVLIYGSGVVDNDTYVSAIAAHLKNKQLLMSCRYTISDFSGVTEVQVNSAGIEQVVELCRPLSGNFPKAIFAQVGRQDAVYGLQRMWETYADDLPWEIATFRDRKSAHKWIHQAITEKYGDGLEINFT